MTHAKHEHHAPGATHEPVALDPEHDIDAKSATIWFIGGTLATFGILWVLVPIFLRVLDEERIRKVDTAPTTELTKVRGEQDAFLNGGNPQKKKLADVLQQLRK